MNQCNSQFIEVLGLSGTFSPNFLFPFEYRHPNVTYCSSSQVHSSSQTASKSVQPSFYGSQMLRCTMHCRWERNPKNCTFPLGFHHPAGEGPSHGHTQHPQKFGKDRACGCRDIFADRQTDRHRHIHTHIICHNTSQKL